MKYHDNDVNFDALSGHRIISGSYTVNHFSVSNGQDPDRKIHDNLVVSCGPSGVFTFRVGRKASGGVAFWFNTLITKDQNTFGHTAGELNFAMIGKLELTMAGGNFGTTPTTFTFEEIALAQGHSGGSNNWWFGGKHCMKQNTDAVKAEGIESSGKPANFLFVRGGNGPNTVGCRPM